MISASALEKMRSTTHFWFDDACLVDEIRTLADFEGATPVIKQAMRFMEPHAEPAAGIYIIFMRETSPDMINAIGQIAATHSQIRVVLVTERINAKCVAQAFHVGIADVIVGFSEIDLLLVTLREIDLELSTATERAQQIAGARDRLEMLSPREKIVLEGILKGKLNKRIAGDLRLSVRTIEMFRATLMRKLGVKSVADMIKLWLIAGNEIF
jgi:two-component system response regulator FixJ